MRTKKHSIVCTALLGLAACSSDNNVTDPGIPADQFFTGGLICDNRTAVNTSAPTTPPPEDNSGPTSEVECSTDLNTALPGPGLAQNGSGSLTHDNTDTPVSSVSISYIHGSASDSTVDLILHNGETRFSRQSSTTTGTTTETITRVDWGIYNATIALDMELNQVGNSTFTGGSFEVINSTVDIPPAELTQSNNAVDVVLLKDLRLDGTITAIDEVTEVASGNINISGVEPNWSVTFDLTLEDNTTVTRFYNGSFSEIPSE